MSYNLILFKSIIYCSKFLLEIQSYVRRDTIVTAFEFNIWIIIESFFRNKNSPNFVCNHINSLELE